jgi:hypothetical protein
MNLTKTEQKILSPSHEKKLKRLLWVGIILLVMSAGSIAFTAIQTNNFETYWNKNQLEIAQKIVPVTKQEVLMKETLLDSLTDQKKIYLKFMYSKFGHATIYLVFTGSVLIGYYFRSLTYVRIIKKLTQSPNNAIEPDRE